MTSLILGRGVIKCGNIGNYTAMLTHRLILFVKDSSYNLPRYVRVYTRNHMSHVTFHSLSNLVAVTPSISHSKFIFLVAKLVLLHERKNNTCDYNAHNMGLDLTWY